jgi:UDP-3-O-[3-hydroxymyristoyl] glucosamine N-acyltransferase
MNINTNIAELKTGEEVCILGYSGSYLSLIFESLTALNYIGEIKIVINEAEKRAVAPFQTNIPFSEIFYTKLNEAPGNGYVFCSNKPSTKKFLFEFYRKLWKINQSEYSNLVHPSSVVSSSVTTESGLQMEPLSVIAPYTKIGFGVNVGRNCSVGHHNILGDFCSIYLGTNIAGHVEIGEGTTIGPGCTIFSNIKIGSNSIIGGGSVVTKDIPSNVLAFGNPCQIVKNIS